MDRIAGYIRLFIIIILISNLQADEVDIFIAAEQGNLQAVKELIENNPQLISAVDQGGYTVLHKAAYNNHIDIAEYLLSKGADINATSGSGSTPLHGAAFHGHPDMVRFLLDRGASIDIVNAGGYTPLLSAGASDQGEIVRLLVENNAAINTFSRDGRTPLYQAVWNADAELCSLLLEKGADPNIQTDMRVSLPYFATAYRDKQFGPLLLEKASDFNETDSLGLGLLHYAAARGFTDQVKLLLDKGVNVNAKDVMERTPLYYARLWGHDDVIDILKSRGAKYDRKGWPEFRGPYLGKTPPGKTRQEFAGDELRTPFAPHGRIVFSPDGNEMLWCHHAMPIQAMWYSRQVNGVWQKPIIAPFTDPTLDYADGNPCFSADGNRIYYHTHRPILAGGERSENSHIWFVERSRGEWGTPKPLDLPVNTDQNEYGPTIAPSGTIYFIGEGYEDSYGTGDIYISELVNGAYAPPQNAGLAINSEFHELQPVVPSDESYILFASDRPSRASRGLQLMVSFKKDGGEWTRAVSIGMTINRSSVWFPSITADDKYVFYLDGTQYKWFSTALIDDLKSAIIGQEPDAGNIRIPIMRKSEQVFEYSETNDIALGDLDSDGDLDAVFSNMGYNDSRVYLNDGKGKFTDTEQILTQQGHGVELGDLDGDGDLDIFMTCAGYGRGGVMTSRPSKIYFNDGKANFTASSQDLGDSLPSGNAVWLYDIDTDGDLDAMVLYYQEDNGIYLNDGHGQFTRSDLAFPAGSNWADLDSDGDIDILCREPGQGFKTLLNDGTGHFNEHWNKPDSLLQRGEVEFGDFDKDGDFDAVVPFLDESEHRYSTLWYNDGTGRFEESNIRLPVTRYGRMSTGDLNGDGHIDIFINNTGLPSAIWLNDGQGGLFDSGIRLPGEWQNTQGPLGDLDGDGDLDVFISAYGGGPNEIWFNE